MRRGGKGLHQECLGPCSPCSQTHENLQNNARIVSSRGQGSHLSANLLHNRASQEPTYCLWAEVSCPSAFSSSMTLSRSGICCGRFSSIPQVGKYVGKQRTVGMQSILLYNPDNGVTRNFMPHLWMFLNFVQDRIRMHGYAAFLRT